jgi:hypothetical protein
MSWHRSEPFSAKMCHALLYCDKDVPKKIRITVSSSRNLPRFVKLNTKDYFSLKP